MGRAGHLHYAHLENAGLLAWVVNAHHVKNVPGHKTDVGDSEWLAQLGRYGLVHGSFIPPRDLRELRQVSRYRMKAANMLAAALHRGQARSHGQPNCGF